MENLQLLSVNVRGLNTDEKRKKCYAWLNELKTDIIFLQETHFIEKNEKSIILDGGVNYTTLLVIPLIVEECLFFLKKILMCKFTM